MLVTRLPSPALRPFVKVLWVSDQEPGPRAAGAALEHMLPTGCMHVVFRLSDQRLRLFEGEGDESGVALGPAVVGGARSAYYVRDVSAPTASAGAQLLPGAAEVLLGIPAHEASETHLDLGDLWGASAAEARERLLEAREPQRKLDRIESILAARVCARLPRLRGLHPAVAQALGEFRLSFGAADDQVGGVVRASGYSHRRFIELFRREVGLTPKLYCRVLRFQRAISRLTANPAAPWVDVALAAGYSDQPHFNREFREFAGVTPEQYRKAAPARANHVPVSGPGRRPA